MTVSEILCYLLLIASSSVETVVTDDKAIKDSLLSTADTSDNKVISEDCYY